MNEFKKQFYKRSQVVKLSNKQRERLRQRLLNHMETHRSIDSGVFSSYQDILYKFKKVKTIFNFHSNVFKLAPVAIVLLFVGLSITAERSVPGDTLYALKIGLNENLISQITTDPYKQVKWETLRLNRRLNEVRLLAEKGELTKDIETKVAQKVKDQADVVDKKIYELKNSDIDRAAIAAVELETVLSMQANALRFNSVQDENSDDPGVENLSKVLSEYIDRTKVNDDFVTQLDFEKLMAAVEKNTTRIYELVASHENTLSAENLKNIKSRLSDLEEKIKKLLDSKDTEKENKKTRENLLDLLSVLKQSQELIIYTSEFSNLDMIKLIDANQLTSKDKIEQTQKLKEQVNKKIIQLDAFVKSSSTEKVSEEASLVLDKIYKLHDKITVEDDWGKLLNLYNDFIILINNIQILFGINFDTNHDFGNNNRLINFNESSSTATTSSNTATSSLESVSTTSTSTLGVTIKKDRNKSNNENVVEDIEINHNIISTTSSSTITDGVRKADFIDTRNVSATVSN